MDPFEQISSALAARPARTIEPGDRAHASVAIVLWNKPDGLKVLLIERSANVNDYWSGQIALPGGRMETTDHGPRDTAQRETREELGLDLSAARYLGRLNDIAPEGLDIVVSCFVYALAEKPALCPDRHEVAEAFWFSLDDLDNPAGRSQVSFAFRGRMRSFPAISIREDKERQLWGITYCLLQMLKKAMEGSIVPG